MSGIRWAIASGASRVVAVGGGLRDTAVLGQGLHVGGVLEPPQYQDRLDPGCGGSLVGADVVGAAVGGQSAADGTHSSDGDVEGAR